MGKHFHVRPGPGHAIRWLMARTIAAAKREALERFPQWRQIEMAMVGDDAMTYRRWIKPSGGGWKLLS